MHKYFVIYNEGPDPEDWGVESFEHLGEAEVFIVERMRRAEEPNLKHYSVIHGVELEVEATKVVSSVRIKEP